MRNVIFIPILLVVFALQNVQAQSWKWAVCSGFDATDQSNAVAVDGHGGIYITGWYLSNMMPFGPDTLYGAAGYKHVFLAKYDSAGNALWGIGAGGGGDAYSTSLTIDKWDNVYISGYFFAHTFVLGSDTLTNNDSTGYFASVFLAKFTPNGNCVWAKQGVGYGQGEGIAADPYGNIYETGFYTSPTEVFDSIILTTPMFGTVNSYLVKYDSAGHVLWAKAASDSGYLVEGYCVATDSKGDVFVGGIFNSPTLVLGADTLSTAAGSGIYLAKYDSAGHVLWARAAGDSAVVQPNALAVNKYGSAFIAGYFNAATLTFDTTVLHTYGGLNMFLAAYDSTGHPRWAKCGNDSYSMVTGLATDTSGCVYATGYFDCTTMTLDGVTMPSASGGMQAYMAKMDTAGHLQWCIAAGNGLAQPYGIAVGIHEGDVYITGIFEAAEVFDTTIIYIPGAGGTYVNVFLANYSDLPLQTSNIVKSHSEISLYPNPAHAMLNVVCMDGALSQAAIVDVLGRTIACQAVAVGGGHYAIDVDLLAPGNYCLRAVGGGTTFIKQFTIAKK